MFNICLIFVEAVVLEAGSTELVQTCRLDPELHSCQSPPPSFSCLSNNLLLISPTLALKIDGKEHVTACKGADQEQSELRWERTKETV